MPASPDRPQESSTPAPAPTGAENAGTLRDALQWEPETPLGRLAAMPLVLVPGPRLLRAHQISTGILLVVANLIGVAIVIALNLWVLPGTPNPTGDAATVNLVVIPLYAAAAFLLGGITIYSQSEVAWRWLRQQREPTPVEETAVLRAPLRVLKVCGALWIGAAIVATVINVWFSWRLGLRVAITTTLAGLTTTAFCYLLTERAMRPTARVVLAHRSETAPAARPGATVRQLFTWMLGTGSAVFGVWIIGLLYLTDANPATATQLAITMLVLSSITLTAGLFAEILLARAVGDPLRQLRAAIAKIRDGDLSARVPIDDATELGLLQAGFNRMATGLQEREALRDLFGRHVGDEVASTALERGIEMGGESREVAAMFVDVIGSTTLAMERPAVEVVALINRFFDVVVDVAAKHGGHVNKFAGDGALIVFGAPTELPDCASAALAAGRELARRLPQEAPDTPATIGISGGEVIAGNIGTAQRFEYTVMGDPVNEAARLGSQAKALPLCVAASGYLLQAASEAEARHWKVVHSVVLRGRKARTDVAALRSESDAAPDQAHTEIK